MFILSHLSYFLANLVLLFVGPLVLESWNYFHYIMFEGVIVFFLRVLIVFSFKWFLIWVWEVLQCKFYGFSDDFADMFAFLGRLHLILNDSLHLLYCFLKLFLINFSNLVWCIALNLLDLVILVYAFLICTCICLLNVHSRWLLRHWPPNASHYWVHGWQRQAGQ